MIANKNMGRGKCSSAPKKDALLLFLKILKPGGQWEVLARVFAMMTSTFEPQLFKFAYLFSQYFYEVISYTM